MLVHTKRDQQVLYLRSCINCLIAVHHIGMETPTPTPRAHPRPRPSHAIFAPRSKPKPQSLVCARDAVIAQDTKPVIPMPRAVQTRLASDRYRDCFSSALCREE